MKISEAFDRYCLEIIVLGGLAEKTKRNFITTKNSFIRAIGDIPVVLIDENYILQWKACMMNAFNQPSSIASDVGRMRKVINYLASKGYEVMDYRDITRPKVPPSKKTLVLVEDAEKMIRCSESSRDKAIIACLFSTGCRISELLDLTRQDYRGEEITVTGKFGNQRPVCLEPIAKKLLDDYLSTRTDKLQPLFLSGQRRKITPSRVAQILHELADQAGIDKNVHPHAFRHGFATDLLMNKADLRSVQRALGHKHVSTTQIYTHITDHHLKKVHKEHHSKLKNIY